MIEEAVMQKVEKQAFPFAVVLPDQRTVMIAHGMSLRDYFAAQVLAAIIARSTNHAGAIMPRYSNGSPVDRSEFADTAYQYADAMLKERAK